MKTEHIIGIGLIVAAILLIVYSPVRPSNRIESLKDERDDWMDQAIDLENDKTEMNAYIERQDRELDSLKHQWGDEDQQTIERNRYQVPSEAKRVNESGVDEQRDYMRSLRDSAEKRGTY